MTTARREIVWEGERGVYHCMVRCVRRAFLCGEDRYSGRNYDHRKEWIRSRLEKLSKSFGIDVAAYAVMSNHLHVVVRTRPDQAETWSDEEVAKRWLAVYTPKHVVGHDRKNVQRMVTKGDIRLVLEAEGRVDILRKRLSNLSWFMKALNEHIARRANHEDGCKGRFWESRFKCQRLEDEAGMLACMCYVDLNPVRAKLAESLEDSEFTSIYDRIMAKKARKRLDAMDAQQEKAQAGEKTLSLDEERLAEERELLITALKREEFLLPLDGEDGAFSRVKEQEYLAVVDWTGRQLRKDKPGAISAEIRPVLESLELDAEEWLETVRKYRFRFGLVAGTVEHIRRVAEKLGKRWMKGCRSGEQAFLNNGPPANSPVAA